MKKFENKQTIRTENAEAIIIAYNCREIVRDRLASRASLLYNQAVDLLAKAGPQYLNWADLERERKAKEKDLRYFINHDNAAKEEEIRDDLESIDIKMEELRRKGRSTVKSEITDTYNKLLVDSRRLAYMAKHAEAEIGLWCDTLGRKIWLPAGAFRRQDLRSKVCLEFKVDENNNIHDTTIVSHN